MNLKEINNLINSCSTTIISSMDVDGYPTSKAMLVPRQKNGIKTFYFSTNTSSNRVRHFKNNPKACLYFYNDLTFQGVMLKGEMKVLEDFQTKKMIWKDGDEMYYSKGIEDSDYCVLQFSTISLRYYKDFKSEDYIIK